MSQVPVWIISEDGAPRLRLVTASMAKKIVGVKFVACFSPAKIYFFQ